jgi:hypothetical protein
MHPKENKEDKVAETKGNTRRQEEVQVAATEA